MIQQRPSCLHAPLTVRKRRLRRLSAAVVVLLGVSIMPVIFVVWVALTGRDVSEALHTPSWLNTELQRDEIAYPTHVVLARVFSILHLSPDAEGLQWLKAAAHAYTDDEIRTIGAGLRSVLDRTPPRDRADVTSRLCEIALKGRRAGHGLAVALSGMDCDAEIHIEAHLPEGQPIYYHFDPPMGGPHYDVWYPEYGVVETSIAPGYWVHNLEHGAVIVLYRCDAGCADLVSQLRQLYADLPPGRNSVNGRARLLAIPYPTLPSRVALISWGITRLLDRYDDDVVRDFYVTYIDQGPECRGRRCPT